MFAERYRLTKLASAGASTWICDADDQQTGRTVTVKIIRPHLADAPEFQADFNDLVRRASELSHPNIAAIFDWGLAPLGAETCAYVVIEQLSGGSLRDLLDRGRSLEPSQALVVGLDACRGLDFAHRRGFVHTELTPSKLVFGDDRRLRIVDFGLAELLGRDAWTEPATVATHVARYASPEQALGLPITGKSDVYALCLALNEAVTRNLPFAMDSTVATLSARIGKLMPVSADLGPLAAVFEHAGRPEAAERASAAEFGRELVSAASKLPRPMPLPLLSSGLFDTPLEELRSPDDPTGGVIRPAGAPADDVVITPLDEPDADVDAEMTAAGGAGAAGAAGLVIIPSEGDPVDVPFAAPLPDADEVTMPVIVEGAAEVELDVVDPDAELVIHPVEEIVEADAEPVINLVEEIVDAEPEAPVEEYVAATAPALVGGDTDVMPQQYVEQQHGGDHPDQMPPAPAARRPRRWTKFLMALLLLAMLGGLAYAAYVLMRTPSYDVPDLVRVPQSEAEDLIQSYGWVVEITTERSDDVPEDGLVVRTAPSVGAELAEGEPFLMVVSEGPMLRVVPESTGVPLAAAETALRELQMDVVVVEQNDEVVEPGVVISWTAPADLSIVAGSQVPPGVVFELVSSIGPAQREVPDLTGRSVGEAVAIGDELGLVVFESRQIFSDDVPKEEIMEQSPTPGSLVDRGAGVEVVTSKGPDVVPFPDIDGLSFDEAVDTLTDAGFTPKLVFGTRTGDLRSYEIDGETPEVGSLHRRGTQVDLSYL